MTKPISPPKRIGAEHAEPQRHAQFVMKTPDITAHSAMPVPIDRSMPPVMMTNVVPSASVPMTTVENRMLMMLP